MIFGDNSLYYMMQRTSSYYENHLLCYEGITLGSKIFRIFLANGSQVFTQFKLRSLKSKKQGVLFRRAPVRVEIQFSKDIQFFFNEIFVETFNEINSFLLSRLISAHQSFWVLKCFFQWFFTQDHKFPLRVANSSSGHPRLGEAPSLSVGGQPRSWGDTLVWIN